MISNINKDFTRKPIQNRLPSLIYNSHVRGIYFNHWLVILFFAFALYLVLPIIDVPLMGLSLSAPIFFIVAVISILKPPQRWFQKYRIWIFLAVAIWMGIFLSAAGNGILSGGTNINTQGILTVIRYAYWLLVFVITTYFASQGKILQSVVNVLGWGIMILALLRWGEVVLYGNLGAWTGTHLMSQNSYGFQFSTFSPFILILMIRQHGWKKGLAAIGYLLLWGAAAINGSRGSWISMAVGLVLCLLILVLTRPSRIVKLLVQLALLVGILSAAWIAFPNAASVITSRFNTLQALDDEKSYIIRQLMIQKGLRLFAQSPIIGVGAARFTQSSVPLDIPVVLSYASQDHFDNKSAHNSYIDFLAESGLVGAIPFAILLAFLSVMGFRRAYSGSRYGQYTALAIFMSFIQMSTHMWAIASLTNTANWFIYGLIAATIMISKNQADLRKGKLCV